MFFFLFVFLLLTRPGGRGLVLDVAEDQEVAVQPVQVLASTSHLGYHSFFISLCVEESDQIFFSNSSKGKNNKNPDPKLLTAGR